MARTFVAASSTALQKNAAIHSGFPCTLAAWFKPSNVAGAVSKSLICFDNGSTASNFLMLRSNVTSGGAVALCGNGSVSGVSGVAGSVSDGVWNHFAAVFPATNSRTAYLNGTPGTTDTTDVNPAPSITESKIGRFYDGTFGQSADGDIAEAAVWNVALDAAEVNALAKGFSPLLIRPASLVAYWPLLGNNSPEIDRWKNAHELTLINSPAKADHPRIYYPTGALYYPRGVAGAPASTGDMFAVF